MSDGGYSGRGLALRCRAHVLCFLSQTSPWTATVGAQRISYTVDMGSGLHIMIWRTK